MTECQTNQPGEQTEYNPDSVDYCNGTLDLEPLNVGLWTLVLGLWRFGMIKARPKASPLISPGPVLR